MASLPTDASNSSENQWIIPLTARREFISRFVTHSIVGWIVAQMLNTILLVGLVMNSRGMAETQAAIPPAFLTGTIEGIGLGIGQWLLLRRYLRQSQFWIAATGIGWLLLVLTVQNWLHPLHLVLFSFGLGFFQWLVLRRSTSAIWWIGIPAAGSLISPIFSILFLTFTEGSGAYTPITSVQLGGLIGISLAQAAGLCFCRRQHVHTNDRL